MIKKLLTVAAVAIMALSVTACGGGDEFEEVITTDDYNPSDPGGFGMTYNGKLGMDMGGGFVIPLDGSSPGLGFGM